MTALLRKLTGFYVAGIVFAVFGGVCALGGAAWFYVTLAADLKARGVL
jgi:hypothetical protein